MKYIIPVTLIIVLFLLFALSPLSKEPVKESVNSTNAVPENSSAGAPLETPRTTTAAEKKQAATSTGKWAPPGFTGPAGAPRTQGPTSLPPNY